MIQHHSYPVNNIQQWLVNVGDTPILPPFFLWQIRWFFAQHQHPPLPSKLPLRPNRGLADPRWSGGFHSHGETIVPFKRLRYRGYPRPQENHDGKPQHRWFILWKIPSINGWWLGVPRFQESSVGYFTPVISGDCPYLSDVIQTRVKEPTYKTYQRWDEPPSKPQHDTRGSIYHYLTNPFPLLLNPSPILKTRVHLQFRKICGWPIWLLIDPL